MTYLFIHLQAMPSYSEMPNAHELLVEFEETIDLDCLDSSFNIRPLD